MKCWTVWSSHVHNVSRQRIFDTVKLFSDAHNRKCFCSQKVTTLSGCVRPWVFAGIILESLVQFDPSQRAVPSWFWQVYSLESCIHHHRQKTQCCWKTDEWSIFKIFYYNSSYNFEGDWYPMVAVLPCTCMCGCLLTPAQPQPLHSVPQNKRQCGIYLQLWKPSQNVTWWAKGQSVWFSECGRLWLWCVSSTCLYDGKGFRPSSFPNLHMLCWAYTSSCPICSHVYLF